MYKRLSASERRIIDETKKQGEKFHSSLPEPASGTKNGKITSGGKLWSYVMLVGIFLALVFLSFVVLALLTGQSS